MFMLNGNPLSPDRAFKDANGIQYPANWLRCASAADKVRIGITEEPDPPVYDQRYYWDNGVPKDLAMVQEVRAQEAKAQAAAFLAQTDWEMVRAMERAMAATLDAAGKALAAEREAIRAASNVAEAEIAACAEVEELVAVKVDVMGAAIKSGDVRVETVERMGIGAEEAPEQEVP